MVLGLISNAYIKTALPHKSHYRSTFEANGAFASKIDIVVERFLVGPRSWRSVGLKVESVRLTQTL